MANYQLIDVVLANSESPIWEEAVLEWAIGGCTIDHNCSSRCVCGKENIKYLFTISNMFTGHVLFPIGSRCINKFGRKDLDDIVSVHEQMAKLLEAVKMGSFITFDSQLFSRKLLKYLYENDCFQPSPYNQNNPFRDYQFLLDVFNSRSGISANQKKKVNALMVNYILPFCRQHLNED